MTDAEVMDLQDRIDTLCNMVKLKKSARSYLESVSDQLDQADYLSLNQIERIKEIENETF